MAVIYYLIHMYIYLYMLYSDFPDSHSYSESELHKIAYYVSPCIRADCIVKYILTNSTVTPNL